MEKEYKLSTEECVVHVRHCIAYKKIIMKVIGTFPLPSVLDNHIFTYVGFFPIVFSKHTYVKKSLLSKDSSTELYKIEKDSAYCPHTKCQTLS